MLIWRFESFLSVTSERAQCVNDIHRSEDALLLNRLLLFQILDGSRDSCSDHIWMLRSDLHLWFNSRLLRASFRLDGLHSVQRALEEYILQRDGSTLSGVHCSSSPAYLSFCYPYLYGNAALDKKCTTDVALASSDQEKYIRAFGPFFSVHTYN